MSVITAHKGKWRAVAIILFTVAMLGPWAYDLIHVPAEYPCDGPNVRLHGDFCGLPISILWALRSLAATVVMLTANGIPFDALTVPSVLWYLFPILVTLPILSTLTLITRRQSTRWQLANILICLLAATGGGIYIALQLARPYSSPWGVTLYVIVALTLVALEASSTLTEVKDVQPVPE